MNKYLLILGIVVLFICVNLCGCTDEPNNQNNSINNSELDRFLGTWICNEGLFNYTITFTSDRRYDGHTFWGNGVYDVKDKQLSLTMDNINIVFMWDYEFSNNDNIFVLISEDGSSSTYEKQG